MEEELKKILELSYGYCKHEDEALADCFRKINLSAHRALKDLKKNPHKELHWGQQHHKNYHMN
tara:strand:- start:216 stop:404 length:189 start_codon:yes stop_codon:yes gene_type:complete